MPTMTMPARSSTTRPRPWSVAIVMVAIAGCSGFIDRRAASSTYRILLKSVEAAQRQVDLELAETAMPGGMLQLEAFALAYPDHAGFRDLHAASACQYATGFVFDRWEDASLGGRAAEAAHLATRLGPLLGMCVDANLARLRPGWRDARGQGADATIALLGTATVAHVPALLWIATADAVGLAIAPMAHLAELPAIRATLSRCAELRPGYRDADAEILLGTLEAAQARLLGGPDGLAYFERARGLVADGTLIVEVMFARGVAVTRKDRALFESTLGRVLATDAAQWPTRRLANEIARRKARRYLATADQLFPRATLPETELAPSAASPTSD